MKLLKIMGLSLLISGSAYGFNLDFLNDSPVSYFTKQDWSIFEETVAKTLNSTPDGTKVSWKNPASGSWGYLIPDHSSSVNGLNCRELEIFNSARQRTDDSKYRFCKVKNEWKIMYTNQQDR